MLLLSFLSQQEQGSGSNNELFKEEKNSHYLRQQGEQN